MKILIHAFCFFCIAFGFSQVGINNTTPQASLDIEASNASSPANSDGILIPRVSAFPSTSPTTAQDGMLIFYTGTSASGKGFYYWNQTSTSWVFLSSGSKNSLDAAYDEGGAGLGRTITADNGAVDIQGNDGLRVEGDISAANNIVHDGDTNTFMTFTPDRIQFDAGGRNYMDIQHSATEVAFNEDGTQSDFRVESGNDTHMLFVDGSEDRVGINRNNPLATLHVVGNMADNGNTVDIDATNRQNGVDIDLSGNSATNIDNVDGINITHDIDFTGTGARPSGLTLNLTGGSTQASSSVRAIDVSFPGSADYLGSVYGNYVLNLATTDMTFYGNFVSAGSNSSNQYYGTYNAIGGNSTGDVFGTYNTISGTGSGAKYGSYNSISSTSGGTHYGVYSNVQNTSGYAGYFIGRTELGNGTTNRYIMPAADGTAGQVMTTDGSGNISFQTPNVFTDTDDQQIDVLNLNGTDLEISLQDDGIATQTLDLSALVADSDWIDNGANIERQSGDVYIGDTNNTNNDLYISDRLIDWDNTAYYVDPAGTSLFNNINTDASSAATPGIQINDTNTGLFSDTAGTIAVTTNGTERMRVQTDGELSIGTTTASTNSLSIVTDAGGTREVRIGNSTNTQPNVLITNSSQQGNGLNIAMNSGYNLVNKSAINATNILGGMDVDIARFESGSFLTYGLKSVFAANTSTSTQYAVYGEATGTNDFAGYFLGDVSIGTATTNNYILPASRGTNGQIMETDGSGNVSWVDPAVNNDNDATNEGSLSVTAGGANDAVIESNTDANTVTISGGDSISVTEDTGTGTITVSSLLKPISNIPLYTQHDDNGRVVTNTMGDDIPQTNAGFEPSIYNASGNVEIRLVVRYRSFNSGNVNFMLRSTTAGTDEFPIDQNSWTYNLTFTNNAGSNDFEWVATSGWRTYNAGTAVRDIKLHSWVQQNSINIKNVYLQVRSQ